MKYLLDTDICIYFLNGNKNIAHKLEKVGPDNIYITIINISELKFGAYNSTQVENNLIKINALQSQLNVMYEYSDEIADVFAQIKSGLKKNGHITGDFDILIASFAIVHNCALVTNNTKHFENINGLRIENWSK